LFRRGAYVLGWAVTRETAGTWPEAVVTDPTPDQKPAAPGEQRPVAMIACAIAAALFAALARL
jgi:hypothetical protein